jgi:hypothetical protein
MATWLYVEEWDEVCDGWHETLCEEVAESAVEYAKWWLSSRRVDVDIAYECRYETDKKKKHRDVNTISWFKLSGRLDDFLSLEEVEFSASFVDSEGGRKGSRYPSFSVREYEIKYDELEKEIAENLNMIVPNFIPDIYREHLEHVAEIDKNLADATELAHKAGKCDLLEERVDVMLHPEQMLAREVKHLGTGQYHPHYQEVWTP